MTTTEDPKLAEARAMLRPYGEAMSTRQLATFLGEKTTGPVLRRIDKREFPAIHLGGGRYSIRTDTLAIWLAARLTTTAQEDQ